MIKQNYIKVTFSTGSLDFLDLFFKFLSNFIPGYCLRVFFVSLVKRIGEGAGEEKRCSGEYL